MFSQTAIRDPHFHTMVGVTEPMSEICELIQMVAPTNAPVVIVGESGTGKELVARAIHDHSSRKDKPFVAVNCSATAPNLWESEMFGHEKGAFTGAVATKRADSSVPIRAPCSWMRSRRCLPPFRSNCSGSSRRWSLNGLAVPGPSRRTYALLPLRIEI
jgi:hypothetical protein